MNKEETEIFHELETRLHRHDVRNSSESVSELLADEFVEFGSSGKIYDKAVTVEGLKNEQVDEQIVVQDFSARHLVEDVVLVTYRSDKLNTDQGKVSALRCSIWKLINGKWQMVFHQGTKIPPA